MPNPGPRADPNRPNIVARLKGNGKKRPLLIMGHTDDCHGGCGKWKLPPFSATREGGYVYARGAVDDKDNLAAGLMTLVLLKRWNVPLDRDVIFLAESGEEGNSNFGIQFMVAQHFDQIDAEYCFAEGGGVTRIGGEPQICDRPGDREDSARHRARGERHLRSRVGPAEVERDRPPRGGGREGRRVAARGSLQRDDRHLFPPPGQRFAAGGRQVLPRCAVYRSEVRAAADDWLFENEPQHSSMLRTSVSPNIFTGGYRSNVIPSEAKATLDVRMLPDEDPAKFLEQVRRVVNDPAVDVPFPRRTPDPRRRRAVDSEPFKAMEAAARASTTRPRCRR